MKLNLLKGRNIHATINSNKKNFQDNIQALTILLQISAIKSNGAKITFYGYFKTLILTKSKV